MGRHHRPVSTYSIVAFEKETGRFGVGVQSHYFSVGPVVPWVASGVGAVATQANSDISHGRSGLSLMETGKSAKQTLAALLAADDRPERRQLGIVDASGTVAVHTGKNCIPKAGHHVGEAYSAQANLMLNDGVPEAMGTAYEEATGDLAERLLVALEAAEDAGGDIRGRQSAALKVARGPDDPRFSHAENVIDLRVEDDKHPLLALRRLVTIFRGYRWLDEATAALEAGDMETAEESYQKMRGLAVGTREPLFWYAVALVNEGHADKAVPVFGEVIARDRKWLDVLDRLVPAGYFPDDKELLTKVKASADGG